MLGHPNHLRAVDLPRGRIDATPRPARGDVALLAVLLGVNLIPIVGEIWDVGRWGAGTVGLATACTLLSGRALLLELSALVRDRF